MRLPKSVRRQAIRYMKSRVEDYRDRRTGEVNTTLLVEDAVDEFDLYDWYEKESEVGLTDLDNLAVDIADGLL